MAKKPKATLLVVDALNILHRGFYVTPPMSNKAGVPTNALRGFLNIFMADLKLVGATHAAVVFDRPGENFRHRLYPEYKATRGEDDGDTSKDIRSNIPMLRKLLHAIGVKTFGKRGVEGDDMIGSLSHRMSKKGAMVYISSNDKDFGALVSPTLHLLKPKQVILDEQGILDTYGVRPDQMVDYLMMLGDTVDNIPGINKVGPKTAAKWLAKHGTLKATCRNEKFTPKMRENVERAKPLFKLTRKLITLDLTRLANVELADLAIGGPNQDLKPLCDELEFHSTYKTIISTLKTLG